MRNRTWPVFLVGLGSLLALLFLPGVIALQKTQDVYDNIRAIQEAHQRSTESLTEIERRMYLNSILVRELLLDDSPVESERYQSDFRENRRAVEREMAALKLTGRNRDANIMQKLEAELAAYWNSVAPVFGWTPEQREQRATFFLREQQRPRRQNVLAIAEQIRALATAAYRAQYERVNLSQRDFRTDIRKIVAIAFFIGIAIAAGTTVRIASLEQRSRRQRANAERAEEQLRQLSTQLMHAQEEERKSISRELHDEVGQMLTGLRMELGSLERLRGDAAQFHEHLNEAKSITEQSLRAVRDLAVGLRPSVLDLGLVPALQWQARHFSKRSGIPVTVQTEGPLQNIPEDHSTCVYRIVQETLTNCAKHSNASRVEVFLRESEGALEVAIRDDGRGFDPRIVRRGGLGLLGIEERVRELGGSLQIESESGKGSVLTVRFMSPERTAA
jgi:signal transduction histidine kinase